MRELTMQVFLVGLSMYSTLNSNRTVLTVSNPDGTIRALCAKLRAYADLTGS
jgi:hypothetical protein